MAANNRFADIAAPYLKNATVIDRRYRIRARARILRSLQTALP